MSRRIEPMGALERELYEQLKRLDPLVTAAKAYAKSVKHSLDVGEKQRGTIADRVAGDQANCRLGDLGRAAITFNEQDEREKPHGS